MPYKTLILVLLSISGLAACGSGVSSSKPAVSGGAEHLGVLQHARVTLSIVGPDSIRQVAATETDADGSFDLDSMPESGQLLLVEVKAAPDGRSRIVCNRPLGCGTHSQGAGTPLSGSFRMLAMFTADELAKAEISINPLTHLAVAEAIRLEGMITASTLQEAREKVARQHGTNEHFWHAGEAVSGDGNVMRGTAIAPVIQASEIRKPELAYSERSQGELVKVSGVLRSSTDNAVAF